MSVVRWGVAAAALLAVMSCVVPTDASDRLEVRAEPLAELMLGDSARISVALVGPKGTVPNASFVFESSDDAIVRVSADGRLLAANVGSATVTVTSRSVASAAPAVLPVTVRPLVAIDSMTPARVAYGADLTLYGRGLDPSGGALVVTIEGVPLPVMTYIPADTASPARQGALVVRIAPPLRLSASGSGLANVTVTGPRGVASRDLALRVDEVDIFDPNQLAPASLGVIDAAKEWIGLAFEPPDSLAPVDWYSFTTTAPGDWTVTLTLSQSPSGLLGLVAMPAGSALSYPTTAFFGAGSVLYATSASTRGGLALCKGASIYAEDNFGGPPYATGMGVGSALTGPSSTVFTLRGLPAGTHQLFVVATLGVTKTWDYGIPGEDRFAFAANDPYTEFNAIRYDLKIEPGGRSPYAPDALEPNNVCESAADLLTLGATPVVDSVFQLTADSDWDNDWLRIVTTQPGRFTLDFRATVPNAFVVGTLMNEASPPDSLHQLAFTRDDAIAGWTPPTDGWQGSLVTCVPNPAAGFSFVCPDGYGFTSSLELPAGRYLLHIGGSRATPYSLRARWTP